MWEKTKEILNNVQRRIDDVASDVAVDFQLYSEERCLDIARYITGSDISDFVMYIARQKLYPKSIFDENDSDNNKNKKFIYKERRTFSEG